MITIQKNKGYAPTPFKKKGVSSQSERGYAILELLFYITFFSIMALLVINSMVTMAKSFRETSIYGEFVQNGSILERMVREIRASNGVVSVSATDLTLSTKDADGIDKIIEFLLSGNDILFLENNVLTGNLNTPNIVVTALSFTQITTPKGKAIKITLSLRSINDNLNRVQDFYDTIVLRGDY
ncbi:MAG: hypothetical protein Q7K54_00375 [Candidatus Parcubacteria bacterium]|nr:hypothetical protein [Candidatus Parcubacteria bacterium]